MSRRQKTSEVCDFVARTDARLQHAVHARARFGPVERLDGSATGGKPDPTDATRRLDEAVNGLRDSAPEFSAATRLPRWQLGVFFVLLPAIAAVGVLVSSTVLVVTLAALAVSFFLTIVLRFVAIRQLLYRQDGVDVSTDGADGVCQRAFDQVAAPQNCAAWPIYTVLLPVYDEADVLPNLLAAIDALAYPKDRLDVLLIVEEGDQTTRARVKALEQDGGIAGYVTVIVVPPGHPKTKPRALNYAMTFARGDYVVIYDAEDVPEPDQLRRALSRFAMGPKDLGCLQAQLQTYNPHETWYSRQFSIEYTSLFDAILPTLERLGLPLPLGGTSNHFRRDVLDGVCRWDPFNVTEDADLGLRLARRGWRVSVLASTTWEEAPPDFSIWLGQRTRWLKGWLQTYFVQMRSPATLLRDLGWWQFAGFQILMGGLLLSALIHPWFYVYLLAVLADAAPTDFEPLSQGAPGIGIFQAVSGNWLLLVGVVNLLLGNVSAMVLGAVAVTKRGRRRLRWQVLWMPIYWLGISLAAHKAIWEFARNPFHWEKTPHRKREAGRLVGAGEE